MVSSFGRVEVSLISFHMMVPGSSFMNAIFLMLATALSVAVRYTFHFWVSVVVLKASMEPPLETAFVS